MVMTDMTMTTIIITTTMTTAGIDSGSGDGHDNDYVRVTSKMAMIKVVTATRQ